MKRFFCFLTIFTILLSSIFVNVKSVYAISDVDSALNILKTIRESINDSPSNDPGSTWLSIMYPVGVLIPEKWQSTTYSTIQDWIRGYSSGGHGFDDLSNASDSEVQSAIGQFILDNSTDNSINNNFRDLIIYLNDQINESDLAYAYTFDLSKGAGVFSYTNTYLAFSGFIPTPVLQGNKFYVISAVHVSLSSSNYIYVWDLDEHPYLYVKPTVQSSPAYGVSVYDGLTNRVLNADSTYRYNTTLQDWEAVSVSQTGFGVSLDPSKQTPYYTGVYNFGFNKGKTTRLRYFSFGINPTAQDILYQPYYYNNTVWEDFSSSTGDYTLTNNNINTITYGDTTSYIDSFNQTNGVPPSVTNIDTWIENQNVENTTPTPTPTPTGTPGGDDSSDDGSGSNIFDVLTRLGQAIGNLISGIGSFLTGIVEGLVSAVTSLLSKLSELITGTLESLTNIFSGLISFVYAGLPEEVQGLLLLCLTMALLVTVIQLIRGK